ncbi:type II secretion system protein GspJ [Candidatus Endobugula sertula]|uniref:Type II secretion system protein J n=1 Tax=Candidatus Endobugula sertula TaxID=62101 RepID=A0A1D2QST4_9GAMM|nr:type II secretion system protein GspJ [Candidatus Endobugula sertula]
MLNYLPNSKHHHTSKQGFTLIEMLVALAIGAGITLLAYQALSGALNIEERVREVTTRNNSINRVWQVIADDVQHAVARPWVDYLGGIQPPMFGVLGDRLAQSSVLSNGSDNHLIRFVRSGEKNFFGQTRSNLQLVAYRITEEETDNNNEDRGKLSLWRDYWRPIDSVEEPNIKSRRLLDGMKTIHFRYLSRNNDRVNDEAWIEGWPESSEQNSELPIAIEVTIDLNDIGEVTRLFALIEGEGSQQ